MGEQADEERIAELNQRKDEYEARQAGADRQLHEDVNENYRRQRLEQQQQDEVEASASRIAAGRKKYREQKEQVEASAAPIAEGRRKYREQRDADIEASAAPIAEGRKKYREQQDAREADVRRGYSETPGGKKKVIKYDTLSDTEKMFVRDESEQTAARMKRSREEHVRETTVKQKQTYYKDRSAGGQIFDILTGKKEPYKPKEAKQVEPITTFWGAQKAKSKARLDDATKSFMQEFSRPMKAVEGGRQKRASTNQVKMIDPFGQLAPPQPRRTSRAKRTRVPEGTGMLFSEGFFNPPMRNPNTRKSKKKRGSSGMDFGFKGFL